MKAIPEGLAIYPVVEQPDSNGARRVSCDGFLHALYLSFVC